MNVYKKPVVLVFILAGLFAASACEEPFEPASLIDSRRFLAITVDPLEAAPGDTVAFRAVVADSDGSLYEGPIVWAIATGEAVRTVGDFQAIDEPLRLPAAKPFTWVVPSREELAERFGRWEAGGMLVTVGATAFDSADVFSGELYGEPIPAFKLVVVSERNPRDRWTNPNLEDLSVETADGSSLVPQPDGTYQTTSPSLILRAIPEEDAMRQSFHWFATSDEFDPDNGRVQGLKLAAAASTSVFCVLREMHYFHHDDGTRTRVAGIDWTRVEIQSK